MKTILFGMLMMVAVAGAVADKPNLIVIMCDDLGYADVGFNGCTDIPTPNIDRIADNGVRCTSGYAPYSVCGPSRAGFITGRYGQRFGFERNPQHRVDDPNMGVPLSERMFSEVLKPVGYTSGIVGKWHLGAHETLHPLARDFDYFYGHLGGGHRFFPEDLTIEGHGKNEEESYRTKILHNHEMVETSKYLTDEFSDAAVEFIGQSKEQPFFLFLSYNAPHLPLQASDEYLDRFPTLEGKRKVYAAMVSAVDDGVGQVFQKLEELNLMEDTIIFFLSDNGGPEPKNASDNGPLRGSKGDSWEGGFRVPYAVQWKGVLPEGVDYDHPVSSLDILATITELSGASEDPARPLDGVNLIPYLTGKKSGAPHQAIYLRKFDGQKYTVRSGDYKLHTQWHGDAPRLYNLKDDIGEERDVANQNPEKVQQLQQLRAQWDAELIEPAFLGLIHTPEWQAKIKKNQQSSKKKGTSSWDWFAALDLNKDNGVTLEEWMDWGALNAKRKGESYNESRQKEYFLGRDENGNGIISREELIAKAGK
ncbi:Arylsulfatase [Pontiella desulfatans]|uniref:Arylsulfatase n=1 Tax=Pontiella desulfatans TaxID=2750659 RepID=A0A6C2U8K3_PONDE|nr:sulfatase-like hydrolase/transferase [Pontiella desulfatans]SPS74057.1 sulfatase S1_19 [Kiritimatiellales bacterium]VGO16442.1 Arylsulfatase [Pontiella desulfatans]